MSCPACELDYGVMEEQIDGGNLSIVDDLLRELAAGQQEPIGALVVICPSCRQALARLKARVASRLRKETIQNIHNLLDEAYEKRKVEKKK